MKPMERIRKHLAELLKEEWNGKAVWECIRDKELTSAPAYKGTKYDSAKVKIMYVGHAVNGWEQDNGDFSSLESTLDFIINHKGGLETFVNADGYPYYDEDGKETGRRYYHKNSKFLRLIKHILEAQGLSGKSTLETWYDKKDGWNQKFVWSNLFCLAPWSGGNPDGKLIRKGMKHFTEIIKAQVEMYKPDVVIFCPLSGYFDYAVNKLSFRSIVEGYTRCGDDTIIATGKIGNTNVIVCKRPDRWGTSYKRVQEMANTISDHINKVCKKAE